jgi:hypothetical protein
LGLPDNGQILPGLDILRVFCQRFQNLQGALIRLAGFFLLP